MEPPPALNEPGDSSDHRQKSTAAPDRAVAYPLRNRLVQLTHGTLEIFVWGEHKKLFFLKKKFFFETLKKNLSFLPHVDVEREKLELLFVPAHDARPLCAVCA